MRNKQKRLSIRVPDEMKAALDAAEKTTRIDQATLVRACIEAMVQYVEDNGEITMPLIVKPKSKENPAALPPARNPYSASIIEEKRESDRERVVIVPTPPSPAKNKGKTA